MGNSEPADAWLYRLYDAAGTLLYIGFTTHIGTRFTTHASKKPWWPEVHEVKIVRQPSRKDGLRAERAAILAERPVHNIARYPTIEGKTRQRSIRIKQEMYRAAQARARERGETLTDVVRRALEDYAR